MFGLWKQCGSSQEQKNIFKWGVSPGFVTVLMLFAFNFEVHAVADPGDVAAAQMSNSSIKVTWVDNSGDETGFRVQSRSSTDGGETWGSWSTENTTAANVEEWTKSSGLTSGTTYQYQVRANGSPDSVDVSSDDITFYTFSSTDFGLGATESMMYSNGVLTIEADGSDIEGTVDSFFFVHTNLAGDGQITARIDSVTNTNSWTKVGLMVRDELGTNSSNAMMLLRPIEGSAFQYRTTVSGSTTSSWDTNDQGVRYLTPPKWIRMVRQGDAITSYVSDDGLCWTVRKFNGEQASIELDYVYQDAYWGVALASHDYGTLAEAQISNLSVQPTVDPVNKDCPRAEVDAELPVPGTWIVAPGKFSGPDWDYTTTNPNDSPATEKCDPNATDDPGSGKPVPRRDGPDHPNCLVYEEILDWTSTSYNPNPAWPDDAPGFGNTPVKEGDVKSTTWTADSLWLRKEFSLSSQSQIDELVLWGRWSSGITVYINGILAASNPYGRDIYSYFGLSSKAREALVIGTNVIAVRVVGFDWVFDEENVVVTADHDNKFFDMGITRNAELADVYEHPMTSPATSFLASFADTMKNYMQQQGIPGGTLAVLDDSSIVSSHVFGYQNGSLTTDMPDDAIFRLASVDKTITRAIIVKLIELEVGELTPDTEVFPYLNDSGGLNLGITVIPGTTFDSDVNDITVDHLMSHTAGLPNYDNSQSGLEKMSFELGISPDEWEPIHAVRWLYSQSIAPPPVAFQYSNDGHFLLRYLAQKIIESNYTGGTLESFMENQMGLVDTVVSYERLEGRNLTQEPGYINATPIYDRHVNLEKYYALGASAEGMALYFNNYGMDYELVEGVYVPIGPHNAGSMDGTWSMVKHNADKGRAVVMMTSMGGFFDELGERLDSFKEQPECSWGNTDDPVEGTYYFLQNVWKEDQYLNNEYGLKSSPIKNDSWWSAQWVLTEVSDTPVTHYTIQNRWTSEYLYVDTNDNDKLKLAASPGSPAAQRYWVPELVNSCCDEYRIRNMEEPTLYINIENQIGEDGNFPEYKIQVSTQENHWLSPQWRFCDSTP